MIDSTSKALLNLRGAPVCIVGLGYVGLPLAVELGKSRSVFGFDLNSQRIVELKSGVDRTLEVSKVELEQAVHLTFVDRLEDAPDASVYIVTVPTPIDASKRPDLAPLLSASKMIGGRLRAGDVVIFESTVYTGCTEEDCVPELEAASGLRYNIDFFCGYSPERINPGDKTHRLPQIVKVVSGSNPEIAAGVQSLYADIVEAGTHLANSIKVAEAAKVIENTQRDLNIALINELAIIFEKIGIDTHSVLEAAGTKWNFLRFVPGLVGGHCIGVDPYYLTHKAQSLGYHPEVILAGRRVNDQMGLYIAQRVVKALSSNAMLEKGSKVLVLGLSFKENCPDLRNTRVVDIITELSDYGLEVDVWDPYVDPSEAWAEYQIAVSHPLTNSYSAIIVAVGHDEFVSQGIEAILRYGRVGCIFVDIKNAFPEHVSAIRL